jgi:hypothetical protein
MSLWDALFGKGNQKQDLGSSLSTSRECRCDGCRKALDRYEGGFGGAMSQSEGVNCRRCKTRLCNACHPPSRGTTCGTCGGQLRPNFGSYLAEW